MKLSQYVIVTWKEGLEGVGEPTELFLCWSNRKTGYLHVN